MICSLFSGLYNILPVSYWNDNELGAYWLLDNRTIVRTATHRWSCNAFGIVPTIAIKLHLMMFNKSCTSPKWLETKPTVLRS